MTDRRDPYSAFISILQIDGSTVAGFSEVDALTSDTNVIEYREGNEEVALRQLVAIRNFNNITLKHGCTHSRNLWFWWQSARKGKAQRKTGTIVLLDARRQPALKLAIRDAWIRKWEGPAMNAETNEVAIESLEIVCEAVAETQT